MTKTELNHECSSILKFWYAAQASFLIFCQHQAVSGRMDRAFTTKTVGSGSIPDRVKLNTKKIDIHSFPA